MTFGLPDEKERQAILQRYARHLKDSELEVLARSTGDLSGRDLRDVAEHTERRWASKVSSTDLRANAHLHVLDCEISCCSR